MFSVLDSPDASVDDLATNQAPSLQHHYDFFGFVFHRLAGIFPFVSRFHLEPSNQLKFILNCCMWYVASSMTNNTGKQILNAFRFPVTLTFVQFGLVACCCFLSARVFNATHIRRPTLDIARTIVPLAIFLIVGHVFSSIAISRIPVSLVHTIKALAPLFTVMLYRFLFKVNYTSDVYVSLMPLTLGVILACSFTFSNNLTGLACALGSCLVFVTQNIFSKKILFKEAKLGDRNPNKLDKMNVLFYSSSISFLLMIPMWMYSEGHVFFGSPLQQDGHSSASTSLSTARLVYYFILNGTMNFGQNWFAFTTLSLTSPVTYSILSLLKRIFVITMSIVWFGQQVSWTQAFGIMLTFFGLWLYQRAKHDIDRSERSSPTSDLLPTSNELKRM
ncbi:TPT-domain-containing protein [Hesseltinella vesiculosa]|uniref:TPT-domain-containing protein n=1 Tax=Hesseltinella vesiculosa TaxID=101127 RepID=A0A1X2G9X1_9FUNG|nr:TPT-domain-containing protein [Hesseltinella vesiculosa]